MLRVLPHTLLIVSAISSLCFTSQIEAYCAKCIKIEEDRAREQAANPQPFHYYDDLVGLHTKDDKDGSEEGSETLKEASLRSTPIEKKQSSDSLKNAQHASQTARNARKHLLALNGTNERNNIFFEEQDIPGKSNTIPSNPRDRQSQEPIPSSAKPPQGPSPSYSTIYTIFKTKNFLETLDGSFTLFIPSNEAIRRLQPGTLINLAGPENAEKLAALVSNHVVAQKLLNKDFDNYNNLEIKAISGRNLTLSSKNGKLFIDDAQILRAEPAGYDGIIYIIDKVLGQ